MSDPTHRLRRLAPEPAPAVALPIGSAAFGGAVVRLLRPRQWIKNGLVVAAAGAAGALGRDGVPYRVTLAFFAFCLLASGIYAINDVRDAPEDRLHPRKRRRPVAAGEIEPASALRLGAVLLAAGIGLCWLVTPLLALVGAAYVALTLSYTLVWRHVVVLDLLVISGGFVLRAIAGGVAAPVALSRWFVLVVSATAVFIAAAKRYSEMQRSTRDSGPRRRVLELYSPKGLGVIMGASVTLAVFAYSVWAFNLPSVGGFPWRPLTILPFAACLLRYSARVRVGAAESPDELLLSDRLLLLATGTWLLLFALGVDAAS